MVEAGDYPDALEVGDEITFSRVPFDHAIFEVADTTTEDLGITEVVAVVLYSPDIEERYAIEWATHSETAKVVEMDGNGEWEIDVTDIALVDDD